MPWDFGGLSAAAFWSIPLQAIAIPVRFRHTDGRTWESHELTRRPAARGRGDDRLGRGLTLQWLHQTMRVRHDELEAADAASAPIADGFVPPASGREPVGTDGDLFASFAYDVQIDRPPAVVAFAQAKRTHIDGPTHARAAAAEAAYRAALAAIRLLG